MKKILIAIGLIIGLFSHAIAQGTNGSGCPGNGGTGSNITFAGGSVVFATNNSGGCGQLGAYSQDNSNLYYDYTNHRLGIGTNTPTTTLQVNNGNIRISTTTGSNGIIFQDGTKQTTAAIGSAIFNSTGTLMANNSGTNGTNSGDTCMSGSTLTMITAGTHPIEMNWGIQGRNESSSDSVLIGVLIDGQNVAGYSNTSNAQTIMQMVSSGNTNSLNLNGDFIVGPNYLTAGSHTFCLFINNGGSGTWTISNNPNFVVKEIGP